jgi:hypothetical protein
MARMLDKFIKGESELKNRIKNTKLLKEYNENVLKYASNIREHIYKIKELETINAEIDSRIAAHKLSVETNKKALADIKDPSN